MVTPGAQTLSVSLEIITVTPGAQTLSVSLEIITVTPGAQTLLVSQETTMEILVVLMLLEL
jgi:hypothetical protein